MEQKEFTEYVIPKLLDIFPQFEKQYTSKPCDIINIECSSPKGKLILRLTTQDREITLGFKVKTKFGWHIHMNQFGASTPDEEIAVAIQLIDFILTDKEKIIFSNLSGYFITGDIDGLDKYKPENEIISTFFWSDL